MHLFFFLIFSTLTSTANSKKLPSYINKCSKSDPNLNSCLDKSAVDATNKLKDGNKDLGIVSLEPFLINEIDLGNTTSGAITLHQVYRNMKIIGMTKTIIKDSDANFTNGNCYWNYKSFTPEVRMESDYTMKGQLLIFPINGHGNCVNTLYNISGTFGAKCERYTKKNQTYFRITNFSFSIKPEKIHFDFENIIDGNELLSKEVVKTLNENSEIVYADVGPAFNQVMATVWKETINQVFVRIPENELFLP